MQLSLTAAALGAMIFSVFVTSTSIQRLEAKIEQFEEALKKCDFTARR